MTGFRGTSQSQRYHYRNRGAGPKKVRRCKSQYTFVEEAKEEKKGIRVTSSARDRDEEGKKNWTFTVKK